MVQRKAGMNRSLGAVLVLTLISCFSVHVASAADAAESDASRVASQNDGTEKVRGIVTDILTGEPLIGAGVLIMDTTTGAVTDIDGSYEIDLRNGDNVLSISYIGYKPATVMVTVGRGGVRTAQSGDIEADGSFVAVADGLVKVSLAPDERVLEDAVVTARKNLESVKESIRHLPLRIWERRR